MFHSLALLFLFFAGLSLNAVFAQEAGYDETTPASKIVAAPAAPVFLSANELSIATERPSLLLMSSESTHLPIWSLSGGTPGQSVAGLIPGFPEGVAGIKVEIVVVSTDEQTSSEFEDVYRVYLSQLTENESFASRSVVGTPVRTALPNAPFRTRTIVLESFYEVVPNAPISIRIQREPDDPADSFTRPTGLALVKVTPLSAPARPFVVQDVPGYNSWPVIQALGKKLVCVYCRGTGHTIDEDVRAVYARTSEDGGKTWTPEIVVANTPDAGEVTIGKGLDSTGAALVWVRRIGAEWNHDLYRTEDGANFTHLATPKLDPVPIQITDVFFVPNVGLTALWFAGPYGDEGPSHSWGTLTSSDDGATWTQRVVESRLEKKDWPTEPSAVYLGDGRILGLARSELGDSTTERSQFQLTSTDFGKTWKRTRTNIGDVLASTPSLIFDENSGLLSAYYYHRGRGVLRRLVVEPNGVFDNPLSWPASEAVALGSKTTFDAGNVNATFVDGVHFLAFYSGSGADTSILTSSIPAPNKEKKTTEKMAIETEK